MLLIKELILKLSRRIQFPVLNIINSFPLIVGSTQFSYHCRSVAFYAVRILIIAI